MEEQLLRVLDWDRNNKRNKVPIVVSDRRETAKISSSDIRHTNVNRCRLEVG